MNIIYISGYYKPAYVYGGPVHSVAALCEGLQRQGAQVTVLTTNANGERLLDVPPGEPQCVDGVEVHYYPIERRGLGPFYSSALNRAVRASVPGADLVIADMLWGYALRPVGEACEAAGVPFVVPARGQLFPWALAHSRLKKQIYLRLFSRRYLRQAAGIQCTDPLEVQAVQRLAWAPTPFVVPNGLDFGEFRRLPERGRLRQQLGIPLEAPVLVFVGRLTRIKRPDLALQAVAAAQHKGLAAHLLVAGPDEDHLGAELRQTAAALGITAQVHWLGLLSRGEVRQALADSDLFILPSEVQENFSMATLEALAAGLPVLVSDGIPMGRWARQAGAGLVIDGEPEGYARATLELLGDRARLAEMGMRGRQLVEERFDLPAVARQALAQYEALAATGRPLPDN